MVSSVCRDASKTIKLSLQTFIGGIAHILKENSIARVALFHRTALNCFGVPSILDSSSLSLAKCSTLELYSKTNIFSDMLEWNM